MSTKIHPELLAKQDVQGAEILTAFERSPVLHTMAVSLKQEVE